MAKADNKIVVKAKSDLIEESTDEILRYIFNINETKTARFFLAMNILKLSEIFHGNRISRTISGFAKTSFGNYFGR